MSWVAVGFTGGSALLSMQQAKRQQEQQKAQNIAAAAQTEYSPWTGMGQGQLQTGAPSQIASGLQGGLTGFMQGKAIQGAMDSNDLAKQKLELEKQKIGQKPTLMSENSSGWGGYDSNGFMNS